MTFILEEGPADSTCVDTIWNARCGRPPPPHMAAKTSRELKVWYQH
jgi:hypothetical protein